MIKTKMRYPAFLISLILLTLLTLDLKAQEEYTGNLANDYALLDAEWHDIARNLDNYDGFQKYCSHKEYKAQVLTTLRHIHHLDSLIMDRLNDPTYIMDEKERQKTLKEISKFETNYKAQSFIKTLNRECKEHREIEHEKKASKHDFGENSYDGQKYILEVELGKFVKKITVLLDHIDKHVHHLNLE